MGQTAIMEITQCKGFEKTTNTKLHALYRTKSADQATVGPGRLVGGWRGGEKRVNDR